MNKTNINSGDTWDKIADSFDKTRRKPWNLCQNFIDNLDREITLLDIGCGNGRHLIPSAKKINNCIGIDISIKLLKIVNKKILFEKLDNISLIHSNAEYIPLKNESVEAALFIASLHNIKGRKNRIQVLKELKRVLKYNCKALISVWSRWQDKYKKEFFRKFFLSNTSNEEFGDIDIYWRRDGLNIPRFYHLYSKWEFKNDIKKSGLRLINFQSVKINSKKKPDNYFATVEKIKL